MTSLRADGQPAWLPEKFSDPAALAKSYTELERRFSSRVTPEPPRHSHTAANTERGVPLPNPLEEEPKDVAAPEPQPGSEAEGLIPDLEIGEAQAPPIHDPEMARRDVEAATRRAMSGPLDEETFAKLEKAGIPREVVTELQTRATRGQEAINAIRQAEVLAPIGGAAEWEKVESWARRELDPATRDSYNHLLEHGTREAAAVAVKSLHSEFKRSLGPQLIEGATGQDQPNAYASRQEQLADMRDPRYAKDPAFRNRVVAKAMRSTFK